VRLAQQIDLIVLAIALPVFVLAGWPLLGYAVFAVAWLAGRAVHLAAERRAAGLLADGNRRGAMGTIAWATMGRVWLVALAVLLVGLAERKAGLAAALLAVAVVTTYFAGRGARALFSPEEQAP
jgi:hypothetical protein